jgi:F-type H+-transporting ATPase subunit b
MLRLDINLVFTIINLLIIYFIVRKLLFKPVKKILAQRQEEIDNQYASAKKKEQEAMELKEQYETCVSGIEKQKREAVNEARTKASEEYDRIIADAKVEADKLIESSKKVAEQEKEKSVREAKEEIADLVMEATAKVVASGQGKDADRELYNQFLAKTGE